MEDILISELPLFTGETTGTYILINNSGETETFKVLRELLLGGGNINPSEDNVHTLGNESFRWKSISIGEGTIFITDAVTGDEAGLTISDGVFFIDGIAQAQLPNLTVNEITFSGNNSTQTHSSDVLLTSYIDGNIGATVDLTKQVLVMSDGTWILPDGVEGQIMYFTLDNGGSAEDCYLTVNHLRYNNNGLGTQVINGSWSPFQYGSGQPDFSICTAIFTDGYWAFSGGRLRV